MIFIIIVIVLVIFYNIHKSSNNKAAMTNEPILNKSKDSRLREKIARLGNLEFTDDIFKEFVALDFETTGLDYRNDKIVEIGAVKYKDEKETDKFHFLINPHIHIPEKITKINGIEDSMVKDSPSINEVIPKLIDFMGNLPIVVHNARFDIDFLDENMSDNKYRGNSVIDTLSISRKMFENIDNHRLQTIKDYLKIDLDSHRAIDDAKVAAEIYLKYCREGYPVKKDYDKLRKQKNKINLETSFEYDPIDEDIYKCFIAYKLGYERRDGTLKQFHKIEDKISEICKEHGGRYFKTAAKTAKFAIIFDDKSMFYTYIKELRDKGYKVTSFDKALEYFGIADMWDIKALYELRDEYIKYMKSDC